jgi:tetratricopeptide (TPR) repeat protein
MPSEPQPARVSFLGLPAELRNEVYRHLLLARRTKRHFGLGFASYNLHVTILRTNQQIHNEALKVFHENRFIRIITPWTSFKKDVLIQGKFPLIAEEKASFCELWHMKMVLDFRGDVDEDVFHNYITCLEDLPSLCKLLFYASCQFRDFSSLLHITLHIKDPNSDDDESSNPQALQEALVMPFAILKGLGAFAVRGLDSESVQKKVKKEMKKPNPTAGDYLETAAKLKDKGNAAFKEGQYRLSIRRYIKAYEAMHFIVDGKRFAIMLDGYFVITPLVGGRFDGQRGDLIRHQLGSQLSWNIIQAYLKLEEYQEAYMWAERAISDIEHADVQQVIADGTPNLVTKADKAKVYWRMVLACKGLGLEQAMLAPLMKAGAYASNDKLIQKELGVVEKRLEDGDLVVDLEALKNFSL